MKNSCSIKSETSLDHIQNVLRGTWYRLEVTPQGVIKVYRNLSQRGWNKLRVWEEIMPRPK